MATEGKIKVYSCFTAQEQRYYESLTPQKRLYVDFRGQGFDKANAYIMAGFSGNNPAQCAYNMEKRDVGLGDLVGVLKRDNIVKTIDEDESKLNKRIDALAQQQKAEDIIGLIDNADGETADRIKFYRDVANGKVRTKKTVREYDSKHNLVKTRVEETEDVSIKMQARKELDRILGLNSVIDLGKINMGDITINIVDASNKNALEDSRNNAVVSINEDEVVDGEIIEDGK